jgi:hypothetical protein
MDHPPKPILWAEWGEAESSQVARRTQEELLNIREFLG